jgi:hypothetical protein
MTDHLRPDDFAAALDGTSGERATTHLTSCAMCREELATLRTQWDAVAAADVPEPSPLFWDHFSARVRQATVQAPPDAGWWSLRRLVLAGGAAGVAVLLGVGLWPPASFVGEGGGVPIVEAPEVIVAFDDVATAFEAMPVDDVDAFSPAGMATWAMVDDLTDDERAAFVRLVEQQLEALPCRGRSCLD